MHVMSPLNIYLVVQRHICVDIDVTCLAFMLSILSFETASLIMIDTRKTCSFCSLQLGAKCCIVELWHCIAA